MTDEKKDPKIADITDDKELSEKDMQEVSGGFLKKPIFKSSSSDDCGGNCMGSVPTATGKEVEL